METDQKSQSLALADILAEIPEAPPAPKRASRAAIHTRAEIIERIAPFAIRAFLRGEGISPMRLAEESGLLGEYPAPSGAAKTVGDATGHAASGAKLAKKKGKILPTRENARRLLGRLTDESLAALVDLVGLPHRELIDRVLELPTEPALDPSKNEPGPPAEA